MTVFKRLLLLLPCLLFLVPSSSALAATAGPGWSIDSIASPTDVSVSKGGTYELEVTNAGSEASSEAEPTVIEDVVPAGLTPGEATGPGCAPPTGQVVRCEFTAAVAPGQTLRVSIPVSVNQPEKQGPATNVVTVSGGGAPAVKDSQVNRISPEPPLFGPATFDFSIDGSNGMDDAQAGDHPYELTTTIDPRSVIAEKNEVSPVPSGVQDLKDVVVDLPLGFAGSTLAAPECTESQLASAEFSKTGPGVVSGTGCPSETVVGHILTEPNVKTSIDSPIWNLVPEHGYPAEFGYIDGVEGTHVFYVHVVPTPQGYVLQTVNSEIPQVPINHIVVSFYGDPAQRDDTSHAHVPFFTDPTACENGPMTATIWMDSWQNPGSYNPDGTPNLEGDPSAWIKATSESPAVTGCDELRFTPALEAQPTTHQADTPSGLDFGLTLPQTEDVGVPATPALKDAVVTLPEGMTVDPSAADGLGVCTEAQIGWLGPDGPNGESEPLPNRGLTNFSPDKPGGAGGCPEDSKIGSLELETPLLPGKLYGELFLAAQNENPFGATLAGYIVVNDPITGVVLKIAGEIKANPQTGRITAAFEENPQLPFSNLKLHFFGGPRAELATPPSCGIYNTGSELSPWSIEGKELPATPFDNYAIDENCAIGFNPSFTGGSTNLQAGQYTPFVGSFSREDDDQELGGLTMSLPPGMLADVASVPLCGEAQANAGTCPESTRVGTVDAGAGPGPTPLFVPGKIYLTGPYNGGPYGLSVVVPADPGPFNFGLVVVRQSLRINPLTAAVTAVSNPFPTILDPKTTNSKGEAEETGIPIKLRRVDFDIDRPGFTFNPTNCSKFQVGGAITSTQGASSTLATPFQVTNCATLKFAPKFAVSTSGKTSRAGGASLAVKLTYPQGPEGTYANIARVKVDLPKQLPSRLTTLQKACTAAQFDSNPAGCPSASLIGHATVHTPLLAGALSGPAIFVSHGGEAFPSLIIVLQGDGVTLDLVGTTFISHAGITSSTFKTVPDAPVGSFELTLPEGKYSALAANGNLCTGKLAMPTEFLAQNGLKINESTPIAVTGCSTGIAIVSHKIKGRAVTVSVSVPAAGLLTASGNGLSRSSKSAKGRETLTFKLTQKKVGKLKTTVKVAFTPSTGKDRKKQAKSAKVRFAK